MCFWFVDDEHREQEYPLAVLTHEQPKRQSLGQPEYLPEFEEASKTILGAHDEIEF